MLSCKEVVQIVSSEERPSWRRRIEVRIHLFLCHFCRKYVRHMNMISQGAHVLFKKSTDSKTAEDIRRIEEEVLRKLKR